MKFEYKFNFQLDDGVTPLWLKIDRMADRTMRPWLKFILKSIAALLHEFWIEMKVSQTMEGVDEQTKIILDEWEKDGDGLKPIITEVKATKNSNDAAKLLGFDEIRLKAPWVGK